MREGFFNGKRTVSLDSVASILPLREETKRYEWMPKLMNLYGRLNGFFDDKFESFWEEQTGTLWKEWGKL
jgi:hypothetical protein